MVADANVGMEKKPRVYEQVVPSLRVTKAEVIPALHPNAVVAAEAHPNAAAFVERDMLNRVKKVFRSRGAFRDDRPVLVLAEEFVSGAVLALLAV